MAGPTGLEPATSGVTGQRSNQLSYGPFEILSYGKKAASLQEKKSANFERRKVTPSLPDARSTGEL